MEFRLLGPVECVVEQRPVPLGRPQERCVLAVLLLELGRVVPLNRLIDLLWDGDPPERARSMVHTHVSRLRATLRRAGAERYGVRLLTRGQGYVIEAPEEAVDVCRFHRLVEQARTQTAPAARAATLREALALWHGPPLADTTTARVREQLCVGLDEQRMTALEDRVEADLAVGRQQELVTELTELVARHPLRERLVGLLMLALYRSGQQARALAIFRVTRQRLVDELGIEPAAFLRRLEQSMLGQDPALDPPGGVGFSGAPPPDAPPAPPTWRGQRSHLGSIVGRGTELARLTELLTGHRLVTMVGVGGVGKTTLALHATQVAAAVLARQVAVATLAAARGEDDVLLTIGDLFGVVGVTVAEALSGIERALNEQPYLLVLDNCEHLVPECASLVRRLLSTVPELVILATSREPLGVPEETVWRLDPLPVPVGAGPPEASVPSVALFLRRAAEAVPGFTPGPADLAAIGRICRRVDGLPLALELAASRLRAFTTTQLADHLEQGLSLITGNAGAPSPLAATLDWSYRLLGPAEQRLIARLSVFRGGFNAVAAERVCGAPPLAVDQILPTLATLLDRSLAQPYDSDEGRRYRLLEVVRDYAAGQLSPAEADEIADRHLDHWLETVRAIMARPTFDEQLSGWIGLGDDLDNVRAAAEHGYRHGRIADVVELTTLMFDYWAVTATRYVEMERWFERAAPHLASCAPRVRCLATLHRANVLTLRDDHVSALALLRPVLADLRVHHPGPYLEARTTEVRTMTRLLDPAAVPLAFEVEAMVREVPDPHHRLHGAAMLAEALLTWGRYEEAAGVCARMDPTEKSTSTADTIRFLVMRCLVALGQGDLDGAAATGSALRELRDGSASFMHTATSALPGALLALTTGPEERARLVIAEVVRVLDERYPPTMSRAYGYRILLAEAERRLGHLDRARATLAAGLAEGVRRTDFMQTLTGALVAGLLATDLGEEAAGGELVRSWDSLRRQLGLPVPLGFTGAVAGGRPHPDPAVPDPAVDGPDPAHKWTDSDLRQLVRSAHLWAATGARPTTGLTDPVR